MFCQRTATVNPGENSHEFRLRYFLHKPLSKKDGVLRYEETPIAGLPFALMRPYTDLSDHEDVKKGLALIREYIKGIFGVEPVMKWHRDDEYDDLSVSERSHFTALDPEFPVIIFVVSRKGQEPPEIISSFGTRVVGTLEEELAGYKKTLHRLQKDSSSDRSRCLDYTTRRAIQSLANIEFLELQQ